MWKMTLTIEFENEEDMNEFIEEMEYAGCYSSYVIDEQTEFEE